ncbi:MAG TPA: glycosyltransferase, partial [Chloroflexia bacterium]|nr:glycosyltransferase [Chloroflexia bacterium]
SAESQRPDLILVIASGGVRGGTLAQVKALLPDTRIYCVYPDSPHNLDADRIHCLPFFDRVTASSPAWTKAFRALGARSVEYLPFAADTELHRPAALRPGPPFGHDLAFIGTWRPERESRLERLADFDLCVWGGKYWATRTAASSAVRSRWGGREIVGEEFAQVCGASKILLNIMDPVTWPGPNMRTFEQPACRAFSLVSRSSAVLEFFKEGTDIECFDSVEEARDKIRYYLGHESERLKIADAGFKLVTEGGHTYADRARQIMIWAVEDGARV